jgi:hypothetical protein
MKIFTRHILMFALLLCVACLVGGCIQVEDLGNSWAQGIIDPRLQGAWKSTGEKYAVDTKYISFQRSGNEYKQQLLGTEEDSNYPSLSIRTKTLKLQKHFFLLEKIDNAVIMKAIKKPSFSGLQRYVISGNTLTFYQIDEEVLNTAIKQGKITGRPAKPQKTSEPSFSPDALPAITKLDAKSLAVIARWADKPALWKAVHFRKVANLAASRKNARTYPAGTKTANNTLVNIDLPDLAYFGNHADILRRFLEASPEWMVTREGQELVAFKREIKEGDSNELSGGFSSWSEDNDRHFQTRSMFRFEQSPAGAFANEFNRSYLKVAGPCAGKTNLNLQIDDQGIQSYLAVGVPGLWFEYLEQTPDENRVLTRQALADVRKLLRSLRAAQDDIQKYGFTPVLIPASSTKTGQPSLEVTPSGKMIAWVNPGKEGFSYLKAFDTKTGNQLSIEQLYLGLREYIGWSSDKKRLFHAEGLVFGKEGEKRKVMEVRFELWLSPIDGGPDEKLLETSKPSEMSVPIP